MIRYDHMRSYLITCEHVCASMVIYDGRLGAVPPPPITMVWSFELWPPTHPMVWPRPPYGMVLIFSLKYNEYQCI